MVAPIAGCRAPERKSARTRFHQSCRRRAGASALLPSRGASPCPSLALAVSLALLAGPSPPVLVPHRRGACGPSLALTLSPRPGRCSRPNKALDALSQASVATVLRLTLGLTRAGAERAREASRRPTSAGAPQPYAHGPAPVPGQKFRARADRDGPSPLNIGSASPNRRAGSTARCKPTPSVHGSCSAFFPPKLIVRSGLHAALPDLFLRAFLRARLAQREQATMLRTTNNPTHHRRCRAHVNAELP